MTPVATFLAHAIALEEEAALRYEELADTMEVHNNRPVADLFRQLAGFSRHHLAAIREHAEGIELPKMKPWEYQWRDDGPESASIENTHYLMTPYHCVHLALQNEMRCQMFYARYAMSSADPEVRRLGMDFAAEEAQHVVMLEKWATEVEPPAPDWDLDFDSPGTPGG